MRRLADAVLRLGEGLGVAILAAMMLHLIVSIALRNLLGVSLSGVTEIVADLYMPLLVFAALGMSYRRGEEIRVDLLAARLPAAAVLWQERLCQLAVIACCLAMAWYTGGLAQKAIALGERIEFGGHALVSWPAKLMVAAGFAMMAMAALLRLVADEEDAR